MRLHKDTLYGIKAYRASSIYIKNKSITIIGKDKDRAYLQYIMFHAVENKTKYALR